MTSDASQKSSTGYKCRSIIQQGIKEVNILFAMEATTILVAQIAPHLAGERPVKTAYLTYTEGHSPQEIHAHIYLLHQDKNNYDKRRLFSQAC